MEEEDDGWEGASTASGSQDPAGLLQVYVRQLEASIRTSRSEADELRAQVRGRLPPR